MSDTRLIGPPGETTLPPSVGGAAQPPKAETPESPVIQQSLTLAAVAAAAPVVTEASEPAGKAKKPSRAERRAAKKQAAAEAKETKQAAKKPKRRGRNKNAEPAGRQMVTDEAAMTALRGRDLVHWTHKPAPDSRGAKFEQRAKWAVWGTMLAGPAALAIVAGSLLLGGGGNDVPVAAPTAGYTYQYTGVATAVAQSWVDGENPPVPARPGAAINFERDGDFAPDMTIAWVDAYELTNEGVEIESHHFFFSGSQGTYRLTVPITEGPTVAGPVGFEPVLLPDASNLDASKANWAATFPDAVFAAPALAPQVVEWASAMGADDRIDLQRLAGDSGALNGSYVGLGGWTATNARLSPPIRRPDGEVWAQVVPTFVNDQDPDLTIEVGYDLLIVDADTQLPKIVAWGPWGSAPSLTPGSNSGGN